MPKKILKNILHTKLYISTIITVLFILISLNVILKTILIPSFKEQIITNILNESKRVARHLSKSIDFINLDTTTINSLVKEEMDEFQIYKVHYFDQNGKVLYSTTKENIGTINTNDYFFNIVTKGNVYYKIVKKGETSSENIYVNKDIIEIYTPIMKDSVFQGSFELYYDISEEIKNFNNLSTSTFRIVLICSLLAFIILLVIIYTTSSKNLEIKEYQKKLKNLADTDALTELYNRRYFYKMANHFLELSKRNHEPISVCMIDIDNFKKINDSYGHQEGDSVIKALSKELLSLTRSSDMVARYGGEEFIVLFPNTNIKGALTIAEKICFTIENIEKEKYNISLNFTVSIGVSEYQSNQSLDEFINRADYALYNAKNSGKNRVCIDNSLDH